MSVFYSFQSKDGNLYVCSTINGSQKINKNIDITVYIAHCALAVSSVRKLLKSEHKI